MYRTNYYYLKELLLPQGSTWEEPQEGQADQGTSKQPGGVPLALLLFPDLPGLPPGSSLGLPDNSSKHHAPPPERPFKALQGPLRPYCGTLELKVDRQLNLALPRIMLEESSYGIPARGFFITLMSG